MVYMAEKSKKKTENLNIRVTTDFKKWGDSRTKVKGINKADAAAAGLYYMISLPDKDREAVMREYLEFVESDCPTNKNGLSPLEVAFEKAAKILPVGVLGKKRR